MNTDTRDMPIYGRLDQPAFMPALSPRPRPSLPPRLQQENVVYGDTDVVFVLPRFEQK